MQHGDVRGAIINGFPSDLDWSNGRPQPEDSLLIESSGKFYLIANERFDEAVHRLEQPSDNLVGLLTDDDLFLRWPLSQGNKFCDPQGMARPDNMYCWVVESSEAATLHDITGVPPARRMEFVVLYRTNPDHIRFTFVPGIGITTYDYHHHGTVADTELKLVDFHQNPNTESRH